MNNPLKYTDPSGYVIQGPGSYGSSCIGWSCEFALNAGGNNDGNGASNDNSTTNEASAGGTASKAGHDTF